MRGWWFVAACVLGPAVWGVIMYFLFKLLDKRRRRFKKDDMPPIDYSI